ncbi:hypothetical protein NKI20_25005 [Mesorhizobium sp. M0830]|uniref:hypothetical protein n=1 Tax=Mesorhizobium sp. M0830 TaxID=2957008 RepID=UPI0033370AC4
MPGLVTRRNEVSPWGVSAARRSFSPRRWLDAVAEAAMDQLRRWRADNQPERIVPDAIWSPGKWHELGLPVVH